MKTSVRIFGIVAIAALAASCANFKSKNAVEEEVAPVTPKVTIAQVGKQLVPQVNVYTSTVQANVVNNIAPQSNLRIKTINAEIGDFVTKGQVLARMDVATLEQTKLQLVNDSTEVERIRGLYEVGGVSKSDLDAIMLSYNVRKTSYQNLLENTILRSPVTGVVTARNYDMGDMYSMGQPIFTVQEITPVKLLVAVSESDYTKIRKGDKVEIEVDALPDEKFVGSIERIYPTIDATTHTFNVEVRVANRDRKLRPGMYARVSVNFGANDSVVIPDKALVRLQGSGDKFVYVYNPETKKVSFVKVDLGVRFDNMAEILSGVQDGAYVVTEGQIRIKDDIEVEASEKE